ncbi:hypothetical protein CNR22_02975 [Sphingobacteriaceae bacterium]|nr:hypothetical protein CNR22_02975 [Sphingobacteriaceae bacterium]
MVAFKEISSIFRSYIIFKSKIFASITDQKGELLVDFMKEYAVYRMVCLKIKLTSDCTQLILNSLKVGLCRAYIYANQ